MTVGLLSLLHRAQQKGAEQFAAACPAGTTPRQIDVIAAAARLPGASQTALVQATGIDRSTMADIVRRLVTRGWLRRRRSRTDARAYVLAVTPEGQTLLDEALPILAGVEGSLLASLPLAERQAFLTALERITADSDIA